MMFSVLLAMTLGADPVAPAEVVVEEKLNLKGLELFPKRLQFLLASLRTSLPLDKPLPDTALKDVLDFLADHATPPEAARDKTKQVLIVIDDSAFKKAKADQAYNVGDERINLDKLPDVPFETALRLTTEQIGGTFIVRNGTILITTWERAIGRSLKENEHITLISWGAEKKPLDEVLAGIADRYDYSIVISNRAAEKARQPVTAKFLNVPLEDAVQTLADMNGLKVVRKPNLMYLVDPRPSTKPEPEPIMTLPRETKGEVLRSRFVFPTYTR